MSEDLLRVRDVARLLGVEMATVIDYCQRGLIPFIKLGGTPHGRYRFRPSEIEETLRTWASLSDVNENGAAAPKRPAPDIEEESPDAQGILRPIRG